MMKIKPFVILLMFICCSTNHAQAVYSDKMVKQKVIPALTSQPSGYQFVLIGDSHSVTEDSKFQEINAVIDRLHPAPQFVCLAGDHIWGWTEDVTVLNEQWLQWFSQNKSLLRHNVFHCTANHSVVGPISATFYSKLFVDIPENGPVDGKKLNYYIRDKNFLLVVINTAWNTTSYTTGKGMPGQSVDTEWLDQVLTENKDATYKLVMGHHPVFPVDGFSGKWLVEKNSGKKMWNLLVHHGVRAYMCAHLIAFDVQVHEGVLQITSGGGGYPYFFNKEDTEYNHCVQLAIDSTVLRYQTLDTKGNMREWLSWPLHIPAIDTWQEVTDSHGMPSRYDVTIKSLQQVPLVLLRIRGTRNGDESQTLLRSDDDSFWLGIEGDQLCVRLKPIAPRDKKEGVDTLNLPDKSIITIPKNKEMDRMTWTGPTINEGYFDFQLAIHMGMGPGGFMYQTSGQHAWSSMTTSAWHGPADADWPEKWLIADDVHVNCQVNLMTFE
jgi:hypothetical protein